MKQILTSTFCITEGISRLIKVSVSIYIYSTTVHHIKETVICDISEHHYPLIIETASTITSTTRISDKKSRNSLVALL